MTDSMEKRVVTEEMRARLCAPLPAEAVTPHPTKKFLSSIKSIYVTERLNEVYGVGSWKIKTEVVDNSTKMIVCKVTLTIPEYGIEYECFGGNDNPYLGDAYKGATTDALTKIASWMGIGGEVFRGEVGKTATTTTTTTTTKPAKPKLTTDALMDDAYASQICQFIHEKWSGRKNVASTYADVIHYYYDCDNDTIENLIKEIQRRYAPRDN